MKKPRPKPVQWVRPGLWWLKTHQFFKGGARAIWHREITRRRILGSRAVRTPASAASEIHVLTGKSDWLNSLWALKAFYANAHRQYSLAIHDDGSLKEADFLTLQAHFPDARVITRAQADREMNEFLKNYPNSRHFRATNYLAQKVFDLEFYLRGQNMLLLDSDVLFFDRPLELEIRSDSRSYSLNTLNRNSGFGYAMSSEAILKDFGIHLSGDINSGLGILQKGTLNIEWIEKWLQSEELRRGHPHRVEQTLIAMCCVKSGFEYLPESYNVYNGPTELKYPVRHYYGPVRQLMYAEGLPRIKRTLLTTW